MCAGDPKKERKKKAPVLDEEGNEIVKPKKERKKKAPVLDEEGNEIVKPKKERKKRAATEPGDEETEPKRPKLVKKEVV